MLSVHCVRAARALSGTCEMLLLEMLLLEQCSSSSVTYLVVRLRDDVVKDRVHVEVLVRAHEQEAEIAPTQTRFLGGGTQSRREEQRRLGWRLPYLPTLNETGLLHQLLALLEQNIKRDLLVKAVRDGRTLPQRFPPRARRRSVAVWQQHA